ncbi:MAG: hypothetical protein JO131_00655 [Gammaproteobacteria bacterium]|nr:hypothetical protein [Gammaproteobacteria bacterium]
MGIYIKSDNIACILHVSPSQADDSFYSTIQPYSHLKNTFEGKKIDVQVFGHIENFSANSLAI